MSACVQVDRKQLAEALRMLLRIKGRKRVNQAVITFDDGALHFEYMGFGASVAARGHWRGRAIVSGTVLPAMARIPPSAESVEVKVLGDLLHVDTFCTRCEWMDIAPPLPPQSFEPTLRERVAMSLQQPESVITSSGLARAVATAQKKRDSLIEEAAAILEPLGITYEWLLNVVNEDIAKDRAPGEKAT